MSPRNRSAPKIQPPGSAANTLGNVEKMSAGPDVGDSPIANTAGMIASPANNAEPVSPSTVQIAGAAADSSALRYEPYTTMNVPPNDSENIMWPSAPTMTGGVRSWIRNL